MRHLLIPLAFLPLPAIADDPVIFCNDPEVVAEWDGHVARNPDSDIWQRLHALWLGLCAKVEEGSIDVDRAIRMFEHERGKAIEEARQLEERKMREEIEQRIEPSPYSSTG